MVLVALVAFAETRDDQAMRLSSVLAVTFALVIPCLAACGGAPPPAPDAPRPAASAATAPTPATKAGADAKDAKATKAAALEALTTEEATKGTCDEAHKAALEKLAAEVEAGMQAQTGADGKPIGFTLVAKRVVALGAQPRSIELAGSARGSEVHVLAFAVHDVSLDVLVGKAAATTMRSPFQRTATKAPLTLDLPKIGHVDELLSDSREVTLEPKQPIVARLTGQGCVAMLAFLKP